MGLCVFPRDVSYIALERNFKAIKSMVFVLQYTNKPYRQIFLFFSFAFLR